MRIEASMKPYQRKTGRGPADLPRAAKCWSLGLAMLVAVGGCGESDEFARVRVSGRVTLAGEPLPSGTISFVPLQAGPSARGEIAEGAYDIPRSAGPAAGPYRVEVYSVRPTGRKIVDGDNPGRMIEETRNAVAEGYNLKSRLRAEVKPNEDQRFDFNVERPAK
jgi:hypothetical protein